MEKWRGYIQLSNKYRTVAKPPEDGLSGLERMKRDDPLRYRHIEENAMRDWIREHGEHKELSVAEFKEFKAAADYWLSVDIVERKMTGKKGP